MVVRDVRDKAHQARMILDPTATPVAPTLSEEVRRRLSIGMNQGSLRSMSDHLRSAAPSRRA